MLLSLFPSHRAPSLLRCCASGCRSTMQSRGDLGGSPLRTENLQSTNERGQLADLPNYLPHDSSSDTECFVGRTSRPQRIRTVQLHPDGVQRYELSGANTEALIGADSTFESRLRKLVTSRDNAKRFLRSFIALPASVPTTEEDQLATTQTQVEEAGTRRRSWLGKRRSTLIEAQTMRTSSRTSFSDGPGGVAPVVGGLASRLSFSQSTQTLPRHSTGTYSNVRIPDDKPLASGNGVSVGISLAEPVLFLQGFEQAELSQRSTAMLRGSLHLRVTKSAKLRAVTLKFRGVAQTKWPEGALLCNRPAPWQVTDVIKASRRRRPRPRRPTPS